MRETILLTIHTIINLATQPRDQETDLKTIYVQQFMFANMLIIPSAPARQRIFYYYIVTGDRHPKLEGEVPVSVNGIVALSHLPNPVRQIKISKRGYIFSRHQLLISTNRKFAPLLTKTPGEYPKCKVLIIQVSVYCAFVVAISTHFDCGRASAKTSMI